jgi:hypothetical protein
MSLHPAALIVADAVLAQPQEERAAFLRTMICYAAGSLIALEGERDATADLYRIADAMLGVSE